MPTLTFWRNLLDPAGEAREITWTALFRSFDGAEPYRGDNDQPGWSPARFEPCSRALANVREVYALCLDYDQCESVEAVADQFSESYGFVHTTRKHTPEAPRCRVILPLSRPVSRFEHGELWKRIRPLSGTVDEAAKDASRFWFRPGPMGGNEYRTVGLKGALLDVDSWLSKPDPTLSGVPVTPRPVGNASSMQRRISAYLARMPEAISGQGGQVALWNAALVLARGFSLSEPDTFATLASEYNPRCQPPWSDRELRHTAKNAAAASRVPDGFLLGDDRERQYRPENSAAWQLQPPPGRFEEPSPPADRQPGEDRGEQATVQAEPKAPRVLSVRDIMAASMVNAMASRPRGICSTGHYKLDRITGGIRPGFSWLVGADTSWGKSSWLVAMADENLKAGRRVLIVSSEDTEEVYGDRLVVRRARVDATRYRDGRLTSDEMSRVAEQTEKGEQIPVYVDARRWPIEDLSAHLTKLIREERIDAVAFDYVQEFRSNRRWQDERVKYREIASVMRHIAKDAKIAGILFSQLTLDDKVDVPTRHNIRECRDIANASEVILIGFEARSDYTDKQGNTIEAGTKSVFVDKVKNGPRGAKIPLTWDASSACFNTETDPELARYDDIAPEHWSDR